MSFNHPEQARVNSLTSPTDISEYPEKFRPDIHTPPLTKEETNEAMKALVDTTFVDKYKAIERIYADPAVNLQKFTLISFVPAKGASPNEKGIYGMAKVRGSYDTEVEALARAEDLIKNYDSYHKIQIAHVGRPFPITVSSDYAKEATEVEIKKDIVSTVSEDIKKKKTDEAQETKDMLARQQKLLEESKRTDVDPFEQYTELQVKRANLVWNYLELTKKRKEVKKSLIKTREVLKEMNIEYPEFIDRYYDKYMDARREAGYTPDPVKDKESFMAYLVEDVKLDFEEGYVEEQE